jgi:ABC-type Fe3+-hydroxamate transport system substrate-binding protein
MFSRFSGRLRNSPRSSQRLWPVFALLTLCALLAACGQGVASTTVAQSTATTAAYDVYGKLIKFPIAAPQRIISLSPSMSEILGALHLDSRVVAVDYYTTSPSSFTTKSKISTSDGTYNDEQIVALKPDLVLSDGGLTKTDDGKLTALGLHLVDLPSTSLTQILQKIALVGRLTFTEDTAKTLVTQLQQRIASIKAMVAGTSQPKVLLELDDSVAGKPYVFGGGSFGDELAQDANGSNIFHTNSSGGGYPQVSDEAIIALNPQFVILTEDPSFGGNTAQVYQRPNWGSLDALKLHQVYALNVNIMQHPSQRLVDGLRCLAQLIHPGKFTDPLPSYCTGTV